MSNLFGKAQATTSNRLNAIALGSSNYGGAVPLVYGWTRIPFNLLWYADFQMNGGGGGGKGGSHNSGGAQYSAACIFGMCEGPIQDLQVVWQDKTETTLEALNLTLFTGTNDQPVWSFLADGYPDQAIAYPNLAYVASPNFNLGGSAAVPNITFEIIGLKPYKDFDTDPSGIHDAEPSDIIIDYCEDPIHGCQFPYLDPNLQGTGNTFQSYCIAMGFFISPQETTQRGANDFLTEIAKICNSAPVWSAGVLKFLPYADTAVSGNGRTYTPDLQPLFELFVDSDIMDPADGSGSGSDSDDPIQTKIVPTNKTFNTYRVEFLDRLNEYNVNIIPVSDQLDIAKNGVRIASTLSFHSITTAGVAQVSARLIMQRNLYIRRQFVFTVLPQYSILEPMDLISINDPLVGIVDQLVRIIEVEDDENDVFTITAEEMLVGPASAPLYDYQLTAGWSANYGVDPGSIQTPYIFEAPPLLVNPAGGGYQIWIAAAGNVGQPWGGCDVWMSLDNVNFVFMCTISAAEPARYGTLTAEYPSGTDPDVTDILSVQLANPALSIASGTQSDADNMQTLLYVDGETMAYATAAMTGVGLWNLGGPAEISITFTSGRGIGVTSATLEENWPFPSSNYDVEFQTGETRLCAFTNGSDVVTWSTGLTANESANANVALNYMRRGQYGTAIAAHSPGAQWARIDTGITRLPYDPGTIGQTAYFKFPSFNLYGGGAQSLADVDSYAYSLSGFNNGQPLAGNQLVGINCTVIGTKIFKSGANDAYDGQCYSKTSYSGGCVMSFQAAQENGAVLVGISTSPTTDGSYVAVKHAWLIATNGTLYIYESGTDLQPAGYGGYDTATVLGITYDGAMVRYTINGQVAHISADPGQTFFFDSWWQSPGAMIFNLTFGDLNSATPAAYIARGDCIVSDLNVQKFGGASAWDSDVYSIDGFPSCHVSWKCSQTNASLMIGLSGGPSTDSGYDQIKYAIFCTPTGLLEIYESNVQVIANAGSYDETTVLAIIYDGTTLTYLANSTVLRTVTVSGLTLYMESSFYTPGGAVNSLRFGPGTNLEVVDTQQIGENAATVIAIANGSGSGTVGVNPGWTDFSVLIGASGTAPAFDCTVIVTATARLSQDSGTANLSVAASFSDDLSTYSRGSATPLPVSTTPAAITVQWQFAHLASNVGGYFAGYSVNNASGGALNLDEDTFTCQVEFIKK